MHEHRTTKMRQCQCMKFFVHHFRLPRRGEEMAHFLFFAMQKHSKKHRMANGHTVLFYASFQCFSVDRYPSNCARRTSSAVPSGLGMWATRKSSSDALSA